VMYAFTLLSVPILRFKRPELKREFKVPLGKIVPFFIVAFFFALVWIWVVSVPNASGILGVGISLIVLGVPLYLLIELYNDPNMIADVNDLLAYLTLLTERINVPKSVVKEIMSHMGELQGKDVLEYGCGVGTLTPELARVVGPRGTVYATSFSRNHLKITEKRVGHATWMSDGRVYARVRYIHDIEHTSRVHPEVGRIDAAVSVGMISYIQDLEKVLGEINELMPEGGKLCFVDYGDFFHVIPNVDWLENNQKIEKLFRDAEFSVQVKRKNGLFWSYIFIYGMKSARNVSFI
jgi:ubiquinone/menaquinone biosynthesis C-methylase UbiE